jgi:1-aminocyclopropane-1-carboxylate deaminase/D-cysteine desulfhydrase-like pyridoxal-dependent ACC family enzyme
MELLARKEGILIDPTYNAKGMSGLLGEIRQGKVSPEETVVFVNTGGLPGIFAHAGEISEALGVSTEDDCWMEVEGDEAI